jgi:hypothetical protein
MRELIDAQLDAIGGSFREPVLEHKGNETFVRDILEIIGLVSGNERCMPLAAARYRGR